MKAPLQLKPEVMVFFGLNSQPFDPPANRAAVFPTQNMLKMSDTIEEGLLTKNNLVILTGKPGIGTSALLTMMTGKSTSNLEYFQVRGNPSLNSTEILLEICHDYPDQAKLAEATREGKSISRFASSHLFDLMEQGKVPVIVIDQADQVSVRLMNDVIRFCEAVNSKNRGMTKILLVYAGDIEKLKRDLQGAWLSEGQVDVHELEGFGKGEAKKYLVHRMKHAGLSVKLPFTEQTIMTLGARAQGNPAALDRLVIESLNNRVPQMMRQSGPAGQPAMSEADSAEERAAIKRERKEKMMRIAIVAGLIGLSLLGLYITLSPKP